METQFSFFTRLSMAIKMIFSASYTQSLFASQQPAEPEAEPEVAPEPAITLQQNDTDAAAQLLALLQKDGRLLDFINEDINAFADDQVAAAARVVHQGVKASLAGHVALAPVAEVAEGDSLNLAADYDRSAYRLVGNISGDAPYNGTLIHKGWKITQINLPAVAEGSDLSVVAPAEVEL